MSVLTTASGTPAAFAATAAALRSQSLQQWEWLVGVEAAAVARDGDPRIRVGEARAHTPHVLTLRPGETPEPTTLETWLWQRIAARTQADAPVAVDLPCENRLEKTKQRLLLLVPWLDAGGAEKFNLDLLRQFRAHGWECTVATTLDGRDDWLREFQTITPDVFVLHRFLGLADYPRFLRYLVASRGVDVVVIAHSLFAYFALPYLRATCPDTAFLDYCHVDVPEWQHGGYPHFAVAYQELLDVNVVSSEHLRRWMTERGADASRIEVCTTNVDADHWRPDASTRTRVRAELGLAADVPVILYACRLCPQKQPAVFADTLRRLRDDGVPFAALVAGDGPDRAMLAGLLKRHGLVERVRLLGMVPNDRIRELMQAVDVFFLPSQYEGIALALFEAIACGLPVVSADVGGQRELVTPACGVLVAPGDDEAARYASALADLLRDASRRSTMGAAGRARVVEAFRLDHMGDRMVALAGQARRRHDAGARLPAGLAAALAEQAVTCARAAVMTGVVDPYRTSWRTHAYFALRNLLLPAYDRVTRDWTWPAALKNALKTALLRP